MIQNPILTGFHPDPSIVRVEKDYFLATSTFEWFPGVRIYHSTNLNDWILIATPLDRMSQLDMRGVPDSCGVWAPCLSHDGEKFWLVYSNVKSFDGVWKDTPNYVVTAKEIQGPWSEPIFLGAHGFDGSMFHDEDGRHWYLSMLVDHRKGKFFGGIILQEFDPVQAQLAGVVHHMFEGSELGKTEGPHLYKKDGFYYLLTAEGGTEYGHAVSIARSKSITGPYQIHPDNPLVSTKDHPDHPLQKTGHGDLIRNQDDSWHIVFLTGRPLESLGRCTLGRETAIEEIIWREDGWPMLPSGDSVPRISIPDFNAPNGPEKEENVEFLYTFEEDQISSDFQSLRIPIEESWCSLKGRPGFLRLIGKESLTSLHHQSLIVRRVQHFNLEFTAALSFSPRSFQQMAGIVCYYNTGHYHYFYLSGSDEGKTLNGMTCDNYHMTEILETPILIPGNNQIMLRVIWQRANIQFQYSTDGETWMDAGPVLDGSILSDDYVRDGSERYRPAFTGAFVGVCCQDLTGQNGYADVEWIKYSGQS